MGLAITEALQRSWQPAMTAATNTTYYWLNWRVLLCAIWVLSCMIIASILIWKNEGPDSETEDETEDRPERAGTLYADESWRPCIKQIHPAWLLAYRLISFFILVGMLTVNIIVDGASILYYYTQWTFSLVVMYFGLGSLLSIYGCHQYLSELHGNKVDLIRSDTEHNTYMAPRIDDSANALNVKNTGLHGAREIAGFLGYMFQIIYQTNAGAVMLTDCVFWLIIFPFLAIKDYDLSFLLIGMHSVNAVVLLGDTALNSLFPWFRIAYFLLWTATYVIFQWIIHTSVSIWWPYPFLDLSSPRAPIWYFVVALMHLPCYAVFFLIMRLKHFLLGRWFPQSYHLVD